MSINPQLNASNYILNLTALQNTIPNISGLTPFDILAKQLANVQEMVDYSNLRINANTIASFGNTTSPISMINSLNLCNASLYSNGVLFTMGGGTTNNFNSLLVGSTGVLLTSTSLTLTVGGTGGLVIGSNGLTPIPGTALQCLDTVGTTAWGYVSTLATADAITFSGGCNEVARFTSGGNLGIGITAPVNTLDVIGTGGFTGKVSAFEFLTLSDRRFKTNITEIENPGALLDKMRGVRFMWRDLSNNDIGVIAQELQMVLPEAVTGDEEVDPKLSVAYHKIVPVLIEVVKDLKERVRQLEVLVKKE